MSTAGQIREQRGGAWLLSPETTGIFTPEQLTDEHRLIARTADEFVDQEVLPNIERLETKDWELSRRLVAACAELGLMGTDVPEAYGGVDLDKVTAIIVGEAMGRSASFGTTFGAQTGLAVMPLVCFGTDDQRRRYLTPLVNGTMVGAYALSEAGSGSDALGARTRAARQPDGSFVLSGEKMWITNASFADIFVVFAKVDGEHFTAFLVERGFAGVSTGKEEHKMGLHGSSTAPLLLQEVRVPPENVLGEVGRGHKVAFNVLNYGRFKLGAMASGSAKQAIGLAAKYAASRKQFGQPIANFGAIKFKLAEMTAREFAVESALYRIAGSIDAMVAAANASDHGSALLAALEELAVEASMTKVAGSEALQYILDENVQIHGGNGFVADYPAERMYRDSRVNRIFEGTNEINRLLIPTLLVRRAMKGELALVDAFKGLGRPVADGAEATAPLAAEWALVRGLKDVGVLALGSAALRFGDKLADEQEVLSWTADILIDTFLAESALARASQALAAGHATASLQADAATLVVDSAATRAATTAGQVLAATTAPDDLKLRLGLVHHRLGRPPINTVPIRRRLAEATTSAGRYLFESKA